jgi:hypothetical protein
MASIFGTADLVEMLPANSWDAKTGDMVTRRWQGGETAVNDAAAVFKRDGVPYTIERPDPGGLWILTAKYGAEETAPKDQALSESWELDGNTIDKSIWQHERAKAAFDKFLDDDGFPTATYTQVKNDILAMSGGTKSPADVTWWDTTDSDYDLPTLKSLSYGLLRGVDSFPVGQFVLQRQMTYARDTICKVDFDKVGWVYTTTSLKMTYATIPAIIVSNLPEGYWLKRQPSLKSSATKYVLSQEFWHADDVEPFLYADKTVT